MLAVFSDNRRIKIQFFSSCRHPSIEAIFGVRGPKYSLKQLCNTLAHFLENHRIKSEGKTISLHLELVGDQKMRRINKEYRHKDKSTDVLSFPLWDNLLKPTHQKEFLQSLQISADIPLGDIIVCLPRLAKQASSFGISPLEEFYHLVFHGFLHLWGYDHEQGKAQEIKMQRKEQELLDYLSGLLRKV